MKHFFWVSDVLFLSMHTVLVLAMNEGYCVSTQDIAKKLKVSSNHLQKIHQRLVKEGILKAHRGSTGGYCLNKQAEDITLLDIYIAAEGAYKPNQCFINRDNECCDSQCILGSFLSQIDQLILNYLKTVTIAQLVKSPHLLNLDLAGIYNKEHC